MLWWWTGIFGQRSAMASVSLISCIHFLRLCHSRVGWSQQFILLLHCVCVCVCVCVWYTSPSHTRYILQHGYQHSQVTQTQVIVPNAQQNMLLDVRFWSLILVADTQFKAVKTNFQHKLYSSTASLSYYDKE